LLTKPARPAAPARGKADFTVAAVRAPGGPRCLPPVRSASPYSQPHRTSRRRQPRRSGMPDERSPALHSAPIIRARSL